MKKTTVTKPSFKKKFLKSAAVTLLTAAVIGSISLFAATSVYKAHMENVAKERFSTVENGVQSLSSDSMNYSQNNREAYNVLTSRIGSNMVQWTNDESDETVKTISCKLMDKQNNVVADSLYRPYLIAMDIQMDSRAFERTKVYVCHPDVQEKVLNTIKKLEKDDSSDDRLVYVNVDRAYIKDNYFYPSISRFTAQKDSSGNVMPDTMEIEKSVEFFPQDTTGMWLAQRGKNGYAFGLNIGGNKPNAKCEEVLDDFLKSGKTLNDDETTIYKGAVISCRKINIEPYSGTVEKYSLYIAMPFSFFDEYTWTVIWCGSGLLILALLTAFVSARLSYTKEKANYDIFTARQQTTNAMAHDLKTPLTSISGYAEMLKEDTDPEKREHYIEMISRNADQMNSIVSDILALARSESGAEPMNIQKLCVNDICKAVIRDMEGAFAQREIVCEQDMQQSVEVSADEKLLTRALTNLMHNAAVYSKSGSSVKISLDSKTLSIQNTMEKVPEKPVSELIKPFVKDSSFRGENSGSGVGLSIAKQDLERMGFRLDADISGDIFTAVCKF